MAIKSGGFLDKAICRETAKREARICQSCANLVQVSDTALGCAAHDKLILPNYPPCHGNMICEDWKARIDH